MSYSIRELRYDGPDERRQVVAAAKDAFGAGVDPARLARLMRTTASRPPVILGAYHGGTLVACNVFVAHDLMYCGALVPCYQSCSGATVPEHRGRGLFARLVEEAKERVRDDDVGFLFAFPHAQAARIFQTTLGFRSLGGFLHVRIPNLPGATRLAVRTPSRGEWLLTEGGYGQYDAQLVQHKRDELGANLAESTTEGNYVWGRVAAARGVRVLEIGGIIIDNPSLLTATIEWAMRAHRAHFCRLAPHLSSVFTRFFRYGAVRPDASHLVVCELNARVDERTTFNLWNGIDDAF